jgi:hypothetical protein
MTDERIAQLETTVIHQMSADFIFYHIEKCGGTSLRVSLRDYFANMYEHDEIYIPDKYNLNFVRKHLPTICENYDCSKLKILLSHMSDGFPYKHLQIPTQMKFTCVRNPIDRVISHYYFFDYPKTNIEMIDLDTANLKQYCRLMGKIQCDRMGCLNSKGFTTASTIKKCVQSFYFICVIEHLSEDLKQLNRMLNARYTCSHEIKEHTTNVGTTEIKHFDMLKEKISKIPMYDIVLYNEVLSHRKIQDGRECVDIISTIGSEDGTHPLFIK